ncbi:glycosyltransferase family 2 protein [Mannheimia massilioguelmaensis]|uniref:glycosyltransferase family 2 protein n=1 Tax=Mannheimia massilioguelmaensis TaxID=1604354 RepID=UPI0005C9F5F8|nr:glycosyltransferase family A protein [Mannheimia massilioguelmaensis]
MFSIVVPSYNRNAQIPSLLESLELQTMHNFEVIIVDDCSPEVVKVDNSYSFPIMVLRNVKNSGPSQSRNYGAARAHYDWLLFLDDDDRFAAEKCEILAERITQNPDANFVYHPAECVMVNENFTYFTKPFSDTSLITLDNLLRANKVGGMPMMAIQKSLYEQVNGLSTDLLALEDYEFLLKLVQHDNFSPLYVERPLTCCFFYSKVASVSKNVNNTESAIESIEQRYVTTSQQQKNFKINGFNMLAFPYLMSLSRKAAVYYFKIFLETLNIKQLAVAIVSLLSPKLAINLKRFI